jgi:hypothetical protein
VLGVKSPGVGSAGGPERRAELLGRIAVEASVAWVTWWCDELRRQRRPVAGGWPGTLSEARARIVARVSADLGGAFALTYAELDGLARTAYLRAKGEWRARVVELDEGD